MMCRMVMRDVAVGWIAYELRELRSEQARRGPSTLTNVSLRIA